MRSGYGTAKHTGLRRYMSGFRFGCSVILITISFFFYPLSLAAEETPFLVPISVQQGNSPSFTVYQSVPVDFKQAGMTGFVQILQDKRVTPEYRRTWGMSADPEGDPDLALSPDDPWVKSIKEHPLQNGRLRLIDRKGHVIAVESFAEPLATIETDYFYGTKFPTYLVSADYGVGVGSDNGPATTLVEIRGGKLIHIPIMFAQSLKNGWKIVPASSGAGKEIETVHCQPNYQNPNWPASSQFIVVFSSYRFTNGQWRQKSITKIGIWESDEGWPPRSAFP